MMPTDGPSLPTGLDHVLLHSDRASGVCMDGLKQAVPLVNNHRTWSVCEGNQEKWTHF